MNAQQTPISLRLLKAAVIVFAIGAGAMLTVAAAIRSFGELRAQVLLTFICLLSGAVLLGVQVRAGRGDGRLKIRLLRALGAVAIGVSQAAFLVLVWTDRTTSSLVWRTWWVTMVPSVFVTYMILLSGIGRGGLRPVTRAASVCAAWVGLMVLWLGLRRDMLADLDPVFVVVAAVPASGLLIASAYLAVRRLARRKAPASLPPRVVWAGVLVSYLVLGVAAFYVGRATAVRSGAHGGPHGLLRDAAGDLADQGGRDVYKVQSGVAEFLGDTRLTKRPPFITPEQIATIEPRLRPGDIILERRNWYLSNPCLPGFWPHAALYIGHGGDLRRLGVADHPAVARHMRRLSTQPAGAHAECIIEAVSEGVVMNSLSHSLHADYVAVLRPRLDDGRIATAIVRAFENLGKPYDFNFDFDDTSKLVCTQLVYECYKGILDFELIRVLGRRTLPANELARQFVQQRSLPASAAAGGGADGRRRQLDFVLFLDARPREACAAEATEEDFCRSVDRPRELVED